MKKPQLTIRMTLLIIVGVLNILITALVGNGVYESWINYKQAQSLIIGSHIINALYDANKNLSLERASSLSAMYTSAATTAYLREDLIINRRDADNALNIAFAAMANKNSFPASATPIRMTDKYQILQKRRAIIDAALSLPIEERDLTIADQFFAESTALIAEIQKFILVQSNSYQNIDTTISQQMMFKYFVWELAEYSGQEYAIIGQMIAEEKRPTPGQQELLMSLQERIKYGWEILRKFSISDELTKKLLPAMDEAHTHYFFTFEQINELFYAVNPASSGASYPISIEMWLGMAAQAIDSLLILQDDILKETQQQVSVMEQQAKRKTIISISIFLCAISLSLYCWKIIVWRVVTPINSMVNALYKAIQDDVFEMPEIRYHNDEIGKLAHVLEVFQTNAAKMKQSNEELERFAFIAAHDLKSPLRAVDTISQWLEEDLEGLLPQTSKQHLNELRRRIRFMDKLLDDTFEYARINTKMTEEINDVVTGKVLIEEIISMLNPPKEFTFKVGYRLAGINLQKLPVRQVLYNLINNAINHHNKPNGTIEIDVEVNEHEYIFYIHDDGPGIESRYHQKIFEMFQTLQPRDKSKGRGLGLALARKIVVANGGNIAVESELGTGAVFRFTWPRSEPKTQKTEIESKVNNRGLYA